ncbi:unnamed protein product [Discosporangium mesarthrocarpum]
MQLGRTKIFIKRPETLFKLEDQRALAITPVVVMVQSRARAYLYRNVRAASVPWEQGVGLRDRVVRVLLHLLNFQLYVVG